MIVKLKVALCEVLMALGLMETPKLQPVPVRAHHQDVHQQRRKQR